MQQLLSVLGLLWACCASRLPNPRPGRQRRLAAIASARSVHRGAGCERGHHAEGHSPAHADGDVCDAEWGQRAAGIRHEPPRAVLSASGERGCGRCRHFSELRVCSLLESRLAAASTVCLTPAAARAGHHHQPAVDGAEGGAQPGGRTDSAADEALRRCAPCSMVGIGAPTCGARAAAWQPGAAWRGDAPFQRRVGAGPGPRSGAQTLCYIKAGVRLCNGHNNPFRCTVYCRVRGGHGGGDGG